MYPSRFCSHIYLCLELQCVRTWSGVPFQISFAYVSLLGVAAGGPYPAHLLQVIPDLRSQIIYFRTSHPNKCHTIPIRLSPLQQKRLILEYPEKIRHLVYTKHGRQTSYFSGRRPAESKSNFQIGSINNSYGQNLLLLTPSLNPPPK